jgi:hypothetical protein
MAYLSIRADLEPPGSAFGLGKAQLLERLVKYGDTFAAPLRPWK